MHYGGTQHPSVQLYMLLDYAFAIPAFLSGIAYAAELGDALPASVVVCTVGSLAGLAAGWIWDGPRQYMVTHGSWHLLGAAAGWQLAFAHAALQ